MSFLLVGAVGGVVTACYLLLALFILRMTAIKLAGTTAGEGLAAIVI